MKYTLSFLIVLVSILTTNAQSASDFDPTNAFYNCFNCPVDVYETQPGVKMGIGYGVVKEINSKFDLFANLGYNFWRYKSFRYSYRYYGSLTKENNHLINMAVGGRFHFLKKDKYSLFTGFTINFQTYFKRFYPNLGLTVEPNIGWRRTIGSKHEFFTSIGYDQHLTSYSELLKRPGKMSLNMGFNFKIGSTRGARNE